MTLDECRAAIGAAVIYTPSDLAEQERGVVTDVGSRYAFVRYASDLHSKATAPERLSLEVAS